MRLTRVGLIGCGLIGRKRAAALPGAELVACTDTDVQRAQSLAKDFHCAACPDSSSLLQRGDIDLVVVATANNALAAETIHAMESGCHVLVEKPAARSVLEIQQAQEASSRTGRLVRVGFNHRYHAAFRKAFTLLKEDRLGDVMFLRATYGHGGRLGYEQEWRMNPAISGGGELIDQGVHLIDLARCVLGDFVQVIGRAETFFWNTPCDDNAFMMLRSEAGQTAFMQVSCTEWKNSFSFEIYAKNAKLHITGLGGSYGVERLAYYRMLPAMGPPETTIWEFPQADPSWALEFTEFLEDIRLGRQPAAGLPDALAALEVVDRIYKQS